MNAAQNAYAAFGSNKPAVKTTRQIEYEAFAQITRELKLAASDGEFPKLAAAIYKNMQLWTLLTADLSLKGNSLPVELRAQLLSLAKFVSKHSREVLKRKADVQSLITINISIMKGLRDGPGGV